MRKTGRPSWPNVRENSDPPLNVSGNTEVAVLFLQATSLHFVAFIFMYEPLATGVRMSGNPSGATANFPVYDASGPPVVFILLHVSPFGQSTGFGVQAPPWSPQAPSNAQAA